MPPASFCCSKARASNTSALKVFIWIPLRHGAENPSEDSEAHYEQRQCVRHQRDNELCRHPIFWSIKQFYCNKWEQLWINRSGTCVRLTFGNFRFCRCPYFALVCLLIHADFTGWLSCRGSSHSKHFSFTSKETVSKKKDYSRIFRYRCRIFIQIHHSAKLPYSSWLHLNISWRSTILSKSQRNLLSKHQKLRAVFKHRLQTRCAKAQWCRCFVLGFYVCVCVWNGTRSTSALFLTRSPSLQSRGKLGQQKNLLFRWKKGERVYLRWNWVTCRERLVH